MATEEDKILSIKVDYAEAIKAIAEYKAKIDELKAAERSFQKELEEGNIKQDEYNKRLIASKAKVSEYRSAVSVLEKSLAKQVKAQKTNADILAEVEQLTKKEVKSISEAQAANKILREAVRNLSDEEESAYAIRRQLNAAIEENTRYIQRNSDEYVKQKMNIGNYTESITLAYTQIKNGGDALNTVGIIAKGFADTMGKDMVQAFKDMFHQGTRFMGMLKLLKTALISTGIGAFIVLLGSLVAAFQRTQKGMEVFQRIVTAIGTTLDVVLDRVANFAKLIPSIFSNLGDAVGYFLKGNISEGMNALGKIGEDTKEVFRGITDEIKSEVVQADKLKQSLIQIEKEETQLNITRAKSRAEIERLKQIAEDTTKAENVRLDAARKAYAIEQADMKKQISLQERRLANMLGQVEATEEVRNVINALGKGMMTADEAIGKLGLSSSTMDDFKQFSEEVIKLYELQENSLTRQIELNNKINSINKEKEANEANAAKAADEEMKKAEKAVQDAAKLEDEAFKKEYERQRRLAEARLAATEASSKEELALKLKLNELALNEELRQLGDDEELKLAIKEEYRAKNAALQKSFDENQLKEQQDLKDKELDIQQAKLQAMSDITGSLIDLVEAVGESSKAATIASKVLALAQIAIDTGKAISSGVAEAIKIGFPQNLAAIATTIATVVANMATAIKTVKSAKFATGGDVSGPGTATSDSIPAMLSNGESVMTAKATSMFAPILSAFNQAGGGVPIYGQQMGTQAMGEDMLAKSFAKGLANMPNPVVSVKEITNVSNRVKVIENINRV